jgi:glycerophosphoryl diester phosphodiesterase
MTRLAPEFRRVPLAHRGYHDLTDSRPENSFAAFRAAIEHGYGIELDVQLTSDDRPVVFHDYEMSRLTREKGPVRQRSLADLGTTRLTGGSDTIPSLDEVLALVAGQVPLLIEIKDQDGGMGPNVGPLEESVAEALKPYDGPVAVMSFNPNAVARMASLSPETPRGIVTSAYRKDDWKLLSASTRNRLRSIPDFEVLNCDFISHEADDLDRPRVAQLKSKGAAILCWTIRSAEQEAAARKVADNITFEGYAAALPDT